MVQPWLAACTGAACTSGTPELPHVLRAMGITVEQAESSVRFSFGRFTTDRQTHEAASVVIFGLKSLAMESTSWMLGKGENLRTNYPLP